MAPTDVCQAELSPRSTPHPCTPPWVHLMYQTCLEPETQPSPSIHPPDPLSHHLTSHCTSMSSHHISYAPAVLRCQQFYPYSQELHSLLGSWLLPGLPLLWALSPRNPDPVQLWAPQDARADGDARRNSLLMLITHSWLTDMPKNKHPSVFTFKHRNVLQTWC